LEKKKKKKIGEEQNRCVELEEIKEYAAEDADITFQLKQLFSVELEKTETKKLLKR
jgi:DNA polymerase-1